MAASTTAARRRTPLAFAGLMAALGFALLSCGSDGNPDPMANAYDDCAGSAIGPGAIVGVDTATGELRWTRRIGEPIGGSAIGGGMLLKIGPGGGVAAYDAATGVAKWCRPDDPSAIPEPWPTIAASSDTTVVLHTPAGELTALDLATGAPRWTTSLPLGLNPRLDIVDGTVVVLDATRTATFAGQPQDTTDTVLGVFDLASGRPLDHPDEVETNNGLETGLASAPDGLELIAEGGPEPYRFTVSVKDHTTGEQLWVQTRHAVGAFLDRDIVFVVDQPGPLSPAESHDVDTTLIALRATDGSELWRTSIHAAAPNPTVAGDLVLWTVDSQIQAFDRTTGAPRWTVDHGSPGRGGDATEPGQYQGFGVSDDGTVTAGFIYAEPPYRD